MRQEEEAVKLNPFERLLVNNPIRSLMLRSSIRWLADHADSTRLPRVLEIGCGCGAGLSQIAEQFTLRSIDAFDLDHEQVSLAREAGTTPENTNLWVGDGAAIAAPDGSYEAVFEFTIFHHIPDWQSALREVRRVLKSGGLFMFEELSREFFHDTPILGPILRWGTVHPWEEMFSSDEFREGLTSSALRPISTWSSIIPGWHLGIAKAV